MSSIRQAAVFLSVAVLAVNAGFGKGRARGDLVVFDGVVTDTAGQALEGVRVVLEASRGGRSVNRPTGRVAGLVRRVTRSDAEGRYRFEWDWDPFYNRFSIKIVGGSDDPKVDSRLRTVAEQEIDKVTRRQNPVTVAVVVGDEAFVLEHRRFFDNLYTDDEKRIYEEMGKPDRVERMRRGDVEETSWWYFERGKAYRFRYGKLAGVDDFKPITTF